MSISSVFLSADKLRLDIEHQLIQLDQKSSVVSQASLQNQPVEHLLSELSQLENACFGQINELQRYVGELSALIDKEVSQRREMWRERVRQLADRSAHFRQDINKHLARLQRERSEQQRRTLIQHRTNQRDNMVQLYAKEENSLRSSLRTVDDMEQIGGIVLRSLDKQREHIKNAQSRLMNVFAYLGLSNNLIRTITKRESIDRVIFWVGVLVTCIVLVLLYIYYIR